MARKPNKDLLASLFASVQKAAEARKKTSAWSDKGAALRSVLRPHQARLEGDPALRKAVRSARQVGKSTAATLIAAIRCLERSQSDWVVVGLTRPSVKRIYWSALQRLNEAFELGLRFQHQELVANFPNGSKIFFVGAENWAEIEKLRGGRYHGAIVDECKSFPLTIFEALLQDVLEPALMAQGGEMIIIGTPGDVLHGEFYLATCRPAVLRSRDVAEDQRWSNNLAGHPDEAGRRALWSLHVWTLRDNDIRFKDPRSGREFTLWDKALQIKADRGWGDDHPTWRREYLGEWVATDGLLVYRYRPHVHDYSPRQDTHWGLPEAVAAQPLHTVIGFDFGSRDGTALVVWAFSDHNPDLWELYSDKRTVAPGQKMTVSDIAAWYKEVEAEFGPFEGWPADFAGLATMVMDTLADEHGVFLEPAEKKQKPDHIELFNNDLDGGRIHVRRGSALSKELVAHKWSDKHLLVVDGRTVLKTDKRKESDETPNDVADAALYAFRWCRHRQAKPEAAAAAMYSREWWLSVAAEDLKRAEEAARAAKEPAELDRPWWEN
jgi:hypothetical protein